MLFFFKIQGQVPPYQSLLFLFSFKGFYRIKMCARVKVLSKTVGPMKMQATLQTFSLHWPTDQLLN